MLPQTSFDSQFLGAWKASKNPSVVKNLIPEVILESASSLPQSWADGITLRLSGRGETEVSTHSSFYEPCEFATDTLLNIKPPESRQWDGPAVALSPRSPFSLWSPVQGLTLHRVSALTGPKLYLAAFFSSHSCVQMIILWGISEEMLLHLGEVPSCQDVCYLWHLRARWINWNLCCFVLMKSLPFEIVPTVYS